MKPKKHSALKLLIYGSDALKKPPQKLMRKKHRGKAFITGVPRDQKWVRIEPHQQFALRNGLSKWSKKTISRLILKRMDV